MKTYLLSLAFFLTTGSQAHEHRDPITDWRNTFTLIDGRKYKCVRREIGIRLELVCLPARGNK